jgi:hypothetical protein
VKHSLPLHLIRLALSLAFVALSPAPLTAVEPERTDIEYFNAGHIINAAGTFRFIHRVFDWPEPKTSR